MQHRRLKVDDMPDRKLESFIFTPAHFKMIMDIGGSEVYLRALRRIHDKCIYDDGYTCEDDRMALMEISNLIMFLDHIADQITRHEERVIYESNIYC